MFTPYFSTLFDITDYILFSDVISPLLLTLLRFIFITLHFLLLLLTLIRHFLLRLFFRLFYITFRRYFINISSYYGFSPDAAIDIDYYFDYFRFSLYWSYFDCISFFFIRFLLLRHYLFSSFLSSFFIIIF